MKRLIDQLNVVLSLRIEDFPSVSEINENLSVNSLRKLLLFWGF